MRIKQLIASSLVWSALSVMGANEFTVSPVSGNYDSLEDFTLTFPDATKVENAVSGYGNAVRLVPEGTDPAGYSSNFCFKMSAEGNSVSYGFTAPFTEEGSYRLYIPKTAVKVDGATLEEDILIPYTVGQAAVEEPGDEPGDEVSKVDGFPYSVTPAVGVVATIGEVSLTFPEAKELTLGTLNWGNCPKLVKKGLDPSMSGNCNFCFSPVVDGNTVKFPLQTTEENPGTYIFYLTAGLVKVDGTALTSDLEFEYTIEQAEYKLEMVGESVVSEIATLSFEVTPSMEVTLADEAATLTLIDTFSGKEYTGTASAEGNRINISFEGGVTEPSTYTLTIPEGFFLVNGVGSNRDWEFDYRIKGTGNFTYSIEPPQGAIGELESFAITFEGSRLGVGNISSDNNPLLLKNNSPVNVTIEAGIKDQTLSLKLSTPIGSKGEYVLVIRRGLITLNDENPENDLRFTYNVDPTVTGIGSLEMDETTAEYFTLHGIKVSTPESGIFIRRSNGKSEKIILK